jgi:hypothetical protein
VNSDHWEDAARGLRQALLLLPVAAREGPTGELPRTSQLGSLTLGRERSSEAQGFRLRCTAWQRD